MKIYELQMQLANIDLLLENTEDDSAKVILEQTKQQILDEIDSNMEWLLSYVSETESKAEYYKSECDRITKKRKACEKRADWLRNVIFGYLKNKGIEKAEYGTYNVGVHKSKSIVVDDEFLLPMDYCTVKTVANKTAIKEKMIDGKLIINVDGRDVVVAHTEHNESLFIK